MNRATAKFTRVRTLVCKEFRQVLRDPSSIAIAIVLPLVMIVLFGYELSLDIKDVQVAVVRLDAGPEATNLAKAFAGSPYFVATPAATMADATRMVRDHAADAIVCVPADFGRRCTRARDPTCR